MRTADKQRSARNGFAQRGSDPKPADVQHVRGERGGNVNPSPSPAKEKSECCERRKPRFCAVTRRHAVDAVQSCQGSNSSPQRRAKFIGSIHSLSGLWAGRKCGTQPVALKLDPGANVTASRSYTPGSERPKQTDCSTSWRTESPGESDPESYHSKGDVQASPPHHQPSVLCATVL